MSAWVEFAQDRASVTQILGHLRSCGSTFIPPLGSRVELKAYAEKILGRATRFEAWVDGQLVGLVAAYCNDPKTQDAYVTNVSVCPAWTGRGIARQLLDQCAASARAAGFHWLRLEVGIRNEVAIGLYEKFGFAMEVETDELVRMCLKL